MGKGLELCKIFAQIKKPERGQVPINAIFTFFTKFDAIISSAVSQPKCQGKG